VHVAGYAKTQVAELNQQLNEWRQRLDAIFRTAADRGQTLTKTTLLHMLQGSTFTNFLSFAEDTIARKLALQEITKPTANTYHQALAHLVKLYGPMISFAMLAEMPRQLEGHLKKENLRANTRKKLHTRLKTLLREAYRQGITQLQPYNEFPIGTIQGNRTALNEAELRTLFELYRAQTLPAHLQNVLQYFLFACLTGLRYSDIGELTTRNIAGDNLIFTPLKTKRLEKQIEMRLPEPAKQLIAGRTGKLFHVLTDQKSNQNMKAIAAHAGIQKHVTMHVARHTFGTLFIHFGGDISTLQTLMGHSKIETTSQYLHLAESLKTQQVTYFDGI
jgi:site-specific recombinase XerD